MLYRRLATPDLPRVVAFVNGTPDASPQDVRAFRDACLREGNGYVPHGVAAFDADGRVHGVAVVHAPREGGNPARLRALHAAGGDARPLLAAAVALARACGAPALRAVATQADAAVYADAGWRRTGEAVEMHRAVDAPEPEADPAWCVGPAATADDADVARVVTAAFAPYDYRAPWRPVDAARVRAAGPCVVARDAADRVLGFAALVALPDGPVDVEVQHVAVHPAVHGRGVGHALMVAAHAEAARRGWRSARLFVDAGNPAGLRLYARLGYREVRRFTAFTSAPDT